MESDGDTASLRVGLIHFPVLSLGPGIRVGIWLAGCPLRCPGCIAPEWQERESGRKTTVDELLREVLPLLREADGVTISGGEPFDQSDALKLLLAGLRSAGVADILAYSGFTLTELNRRHPHLVALLDAIVDAPFLADSPSDRPWRGSGNQELHILTRNEYLRRRYELFREHIPNRRMLQLIPRPGGATLIGIPRPEDIEELRHGSL